jgi:hypothetical protein
MTTVSVELPQGVPTLVRIHAPSRLPPPPLFRDARRGSSASGLLRRAGFEGSTARGASREPDSDFSSLPMVPPALPDCARAMSGKATTASVADSRAALTGYRMTFCIIHWFPMNRGLAAGPICPHRAVNAARFAGLAALVKRCVLRTLDCFALDQRLGFPRDQMLACAKLAGTRRKGGCSQSGLTASWGSGRKIQK